MDVISKAKSDWLMKRSGKKPTNDWKWSTRRRRVVRRASAKNATPI